DTDGWTIVDCGFNSAKTQTLWDEVLSSLGAMPVKRVIVTHFHPDHFGLAQWLSTRFGVEVWMTEAEYLTAHAVFDSAAGFDRDTLFELFRRHGLDEDRIAALSEFGNSYRRWMNELPKRFRRIVDGETITIGAYDWRVIVGRGHAPEHASLHCG